MLWFGLILEQISIGDWNYYLKSRTQREIFATRVVKRT
jgi:hypothetical protein